MVGLSGLVYVEAAGGLGEEFGSGVQVPVIPSSE